MTFRSELYDGIWLRALAWLTLRVSSGNGALQFCLTEDGNVGLFEDGAEKALGADNTALEAIAEAHRRYHETPGLEKCDCVQLEQDGDALP